MASAIDRHVTHVRRRLGLQARLERAAWALLAIAVAALVAALLWRLAALRLPGAGWALGGAVAVALLLAAATARRTPAGEAAVAIDRRAGTKDRFATALAVRGRDDGFARAAVGDAERAAATTDLRALFPLRRPRALPGAALAALTAVLAFQFIPQQDWLGRDRRALDLRQRGEAQKSAEQAVRRALAAVEALPPSLSGTEQVEAAKAELRDLLARPGADPAAAQRSAARALQEVQDALAQKVASSRRFAEAREARRLVEQGDADPLSGPAGEVQQRLEQGDLDGAARKLEEMARAFPNLDPQQQKEQAAALQKLAEQVAEAARDPQGGEEARRQLEQMGLDAARIEQAQDLLRQAAGGDPQAQQRLEQMAQQAMRQMGDAPPTPQQVLQMQNLLQQLQAQANNAANAQQVADAMQRMAGAMQQGGDAGDALQQMRQAADELDAMLRDAQQVAAAQRRLQQAQQQALDGMNGADGGAQDGQWQPMGGGNQGQGQQGQWDGQAGFAGQNAGGIGAGDRTYKAPAPFGVREEFAPSQENPQGRVLASTLVRAAALKGESRAELREALQASSKQASDEIDRDRVSRAAQRVVRDYFNSMQKAAEAPPP